ncbi:MAG: sigma-70 family RNA polymerase sigma factor [Pseudonocardiaceae bacterium]
MDAFAELYARNGNTVFLFLLKRTGDRPLAEDLTSETFLRSLLRIRSVSYRDPDPGAWFITIARNLFLDHVKSSHHRRAVSVPDVRDASAEDATPEEIAVRRAMAIIVRGAVKELNPDQQRCISLRFFDDLSVSETAAIMGRGPTAVKALQHRALVRIREMLGETGERGTPRPCARPECRELIRGTSHAVYCSEECLRSTATNLGDLVPVDHCLAPGCGKWLTQSQRQRSAIACGAQCRRRLGTLRTTRAEMAT